MSEWEDKLNTILNDPNAMGQIAALAQSLGGTGGGTPAPEEKPPTPGGTTPNLSGVMGLLGGLTGGGAPDAGPGELPELDPKLVQLGMRLLSEYNRKNDDNMALLTALKPFVRAERYAKLDRAVQIARLSRVVRVAFGALKEQGGVPNV